MTFLDNKNESTILDEILQALEDVKAILLLSNRSQLEIAKKTILPTDSLKAKIYDLCDGTNTTKSIAQALGKDEASIRGRISELRRDGLIRTIERDGSQVHEQRF
jgi:DNA-binding transcriptional ArsR family regulator